MNWIVAGLIGGVGAFFADFVMWGKVFTKGMEQYGTMAATPEEGKKMMAANMPKAAGLALLFGLLLACFYARLRGGLWVQGGGPLAGMEFATMLWLCTIALQTLGSGIWYDKIRALHKATFWAWLVRMNVAGLLIGPTVSWLSLQDGSGNSHTYPSFGGTIALLTGDDAESGFTISRYNDLA